MCTTHAKSCVRHAGTRVTVVSGYVCWEFNWNYALEGQLSCLSTPPASTSTVLGLLVCATSPSSVIGNFFKKTLLAVVAHAFSPAFRQQR